MHAVRRSIAAAVALGALTACSASDDGTAPDPVDQASASASAGAAADRDRLRDQLDGLSLAQRVGQLFMTGADANGASPAAYAAITDDHVGNIMLTGRSSRGVTATAELVDSLRERADARSTGGVDMFVATDQEGGQVQVLSGAGFATIPSALTQGAYLPAVLRVLAHQWADDLRSAGVNMNLAPVAGTVPSASFAPRNAPIGASRRAFGYTTGVVGRHVRAFVAGMDAAGVVAAVKHFPGLGRVTANTDTSRGVTDTTTRVNGPYLGPFSAGIDAGAPLVMMSLASYPKIDPDRPAVFSAPTIDALLRDDLGFDGVVISDDLSNAREVARWSPGDRAVMFIEAGGDLVLAVDPTDMPAMVSAVLDKARHDPAFARRVDESATRVLAAKHDL